MNWQHVLNPGTTPCWGPSREQQRPFFVTVKYVDDRLSITGVEGPRANGDCYGRAGQCREALLACTPKAPWTTEMLTRLYEVWNRWHLNDMNAGSPIQREWLEELDRALGPWDEGRDGHHYDWAKQRLASVGMDPDPDGYSYGSAWLREDVPADVLEWLYQLPVVADMPWHDRTLPDWESPPPAPPKCKECGHVRANA